MMEPPARVPAEAVVPREYIFIVDVSGSMHGFPLETAKALMQDIIKGLKPKDFINVLLFESGSAVFSASGSLPASEANKQKALDFIKAQPGGGGTNIVPALKQALALPRTPGSPALSRWPLTAMWTWKPQSSTSFARIWVGQPVRLRHRHLRQPPSHRGHGPGRYGGVLRGPEPPEAAKQAARFRNYIANPVLTDIKVAFEGFQANEVEPQAVPDLFALRPITLLGKYRGTRREPLWSRARRPRGLSSARST